MTSQLSDVPPGPGDTTHTGSNASDEPAVALPAAGELQSRDQFQAFVSGELEASQETTHTHGRRHHGVLLHLAERSVCYEVPLATLRNHAFMSTTEPMRERRP